MDGKHHSHHRRHIIHKAFQKELYNPFARLYVNVFLFFVYASAQYGEQAQVLAKVFA